MSAYEKPIEDLAIFNPEAFTANDVPLTVTTGAKYFLRYPFAQGTENLQSFNSNGTATFTGSTARTTAIKNDSVILTNTQFAFNTTHNFNSLTSNTSFTMTAPSFNVSGGLISSSPTIANRIITTGFLYLSDVSAGSVLPASTPTFQIYNNNNNCFLQNLRNSSTINLFVNDSGGNQVGTLTASSSEVNIKRTLRMDSGFSITLAGQGVINQPFIPSTDPTYNTTLNSLRRTLITMDCSSSISGVNVGSPRVVLEISDAIANRGIIILPNTSASAFNPINRVGDSSVCAKGENFGFATLTSWSTLRNGFRCGATASTNCTSAIECGPYTNFTMTHNSGVTTTQFNDVLGFRSINGGANFTNLYMDTTPIVPGMFYDCSLNNGAHNFTVQDNLGVKSTPFVISSGLTSYLNILSVRNAITPSNRFDMSTDNSQTTSIRCRTTTPSTVGTININCDSVSAGGAVSNIPVLTLNPTSVTCNKSIEFNYTALNGTVLNQLGGVFSSGLANISVTSSASVRVADSYTVAYTGTYLIAWSIRFNSETSTISPTDLRFGISKLNNSFNFNDEGFVSYIEPPIVAYPSLALLSPILRTNTTCTMRLTTSSVIYFNYYATWTGNPNAVIGGQYSVTRIG